MAEANIPRKRLRKEETSFAHFDESPLAERRGLFG
jgi:hypothetical protein